MNIHTSATSMSHMYHQNTLAIIFDFDDTLASDSTSAYLEHKGIKDLHHFWQVEVANLMELEDWNPVPAYMHNMLNHVDSGSIKPITQADLCAFGRELPLHEGVETVFNHLREVAYAVAQEVKHTIEIEFYLISSGIGDIVRNTKIAHEFKDIWASEWHFDDNGCAKFPKKIVSFTDKTRYLFQIHKGLVQNKSFGKPFAVNQKLAKHQIHIPFEQMIFVGDGYTDIPCFSLIKKNGGIPIAVYDPKRKEKWETAYSFLQESRVTQLLSANYLPTSDLSNFLSMAIRKMVIDISIRQSKGFYPS